MPVVRRACKQRIEVILGVVKFPRRELLGWQVILDNPPPFQSVLRRRRAWVAGLTVSKRVAAYLYLGLVTRGLNINSLYKQFTSNRMPDTCSQMRYAERACRAMIPAHNDCLQPVQY